MLQYVKGKFDQTIILSALKVISPPWCKKVPGDIEIRRHMAPFCNNGVIYIHKFSLRYYLKFCYEHTYQFVCCHLGGRGGWTTGVVSTMWITTHEPQHGRDPVQILSKMSKTGHRRGTPIARRRTSSFRIVRCSTLQ